MQPRLVKRNGNLVYVHLLSSVIHVYALVKWLFLESGVSVFGPPKSTWPRQYVVVIYDLWVIRHKNSLLYFEVRHFSYIRTAPPFAFIFSAFFGTSVFNHPFCGIFRLTFI